MDAQAQPTAPNDGAKDGEHCNMNYPVLKETNTGWCEWQYPEMKKYRMACCDCGLVHTLQFAVVENTGRGPAKGEFVFRVLPSKKLRVRLRARRDEKETRLLRKREKIVVGQNKNK